MYFWLWKIPVKTDETKVHDRRSAEENIQSSPYITPDFSKHPVAKQLKCQAKYENSYKREHADVSMFYVSVIFEAFRAKDRNRVGFGKGLVSI